MFLSGTEDNGPSRVLHSGRLYARTQWAVALMACHRNPLTALTVVAETPPGTMYSFGFNIALFGYSFLFIYFSLKAHLCIFVCLFIYIFIHFLLSLTSIPVILSRG